MTYPATLLRWLMVLFNQWRTVRLAGACMALALLSGCWMSDEPLIGTEHASTVDFAGPYRPKKEDVVVEVTANPDGSYSLIDNKGEGFTAFFMDVGDGWYLVQQDCAKLARDGAVKDPTGSALELSAKEGEGPYLYNLMKLNGKDLWFYMPECDAATQAVSGVTLDLQAEKFAATCKFPSVEVLQEAAPAFIARVDAGEYADEPGILRSIAGEAE
jgi:hypothetical protein